MPRLRIDEKTDIHGKILIRNVENPLTFGAMKHYGIGVVHDGADFVIHVTGSPWLHIRGRQRIAMHPIQRGPKWWLETAHPASPRHPDKIVNIAKSFIGQDFNFSFLFSNCQHFATFCVYGVGHSADVLRLCGGFAPRDQISKITSFSGHHAWFRRSLWALVRGTPLRRLATAVLGKSFPGGCEFIFVGHKIVHKSLRNAAGEAVYGFEIGPEKMELNQ